MSGRGCRIRTCDHLSDPASKAGGMDRSRQAPTDSSTSSLNLLILSTYIFSTHVPCRRSVGRGGRIRTCDLLSDPVSETGGLSLSLHAPTVLHLSLHLFIPYLCASSPLAGAAGFEPAISFRTRVQSPVAWASRSTPQLISTLHAYINCSTVQRFTSGGGGGNRTHDSWIKSPPLCL
jgi:hypothetical protein